MNIIKKLITFKKAILKYITQTLLSQAYISNMSLHCGFLFPKKDFKLIFMNTIGYISDNVFYRINLQTLQTQIVHHPEGRSYQAFTANYKRQLIVLVDYGKNPTFYFEFHDKAKSFEVRNICPLEVLKIEMSLNAKYLAIVCGVPHPRIVFYDIENRRLLEGQKSFISIQQNFAQIKQIAFNPSNPRQLAIHYPTRIQLHQIKQCFQLDPNESLHESITVKKIDTLTDEQIETFVWDQINNWYLSNGKEIYIYSTDTRSKVLTCDIQLDYEDEQGVVANIVLTKKHVIVFYRMGRVEWMNKYYPEAMEEEDVSLRPFYLDKFYETGKQIRYSMYDGQFTKIFITFAEGCFGILPKPAQSNQADEEQDENMKKKNLNAKEKKIDLQLIFSPYYHSSPIVLIHEFQNTAACITLSSAGRFILWSVKQKKQLQTHAILPDITTASVNKAGNILATGHSNGIVRFYSIAKPNDIFLFKEFKMVKNGPIDKLIFSSNGQEMAVLSKTENRIYYILTSLSMDFQVLGFVQVPFPIKSIAWIGPTKSVITARFEYLLVCIGFGIVMVNSPVAVPTKKRGKDLDLKLEMYALRTDANQTLVSGLPSGELITTGKDKFIKKYKQPQDLIQKIDWKSKVPPNPPLEQLQGHDFQIEQFQHSPHYLLSCGKEGKIQLRDYNNFKDMKQIKAYGWKNSLLAYVVGSWNKGLIYTAGRDGSFYIWKVEQCQVQGDDKIDLQVPNHKKINPAQQVKYYEITIEDEYRERMKQKIEQKKRDQLSKLSKIRNQLKILLEQNQKHEELQRLPRDDFAIDLFTKQKIAKQGEQQCKKIIQESKKRILVNQVYAKKLKQITWDRMDVHLSAINGLKNNYIVYNYQIRKISAIQKRKIKLILDLRKAQKREQKKRNTSIIDFDQFKNKNIINGGYVTPLVMTQIQAKKQESKKDDKKKKKQQQTAPSNQQQQGQQQLPTQQQWSLLYSSFQLYNSNAKRNQIIMMRNIITLVKKSFNKEFTKLLKLRQNQNEMINDKNKRIIEICEQLKRENQIIVSRDNILESNDNVLQVKLSEIPFQRYLSRQERDKLQKERLKEEERLRKLAEDDSAQRALQKMMGGTLEEKKVSALEINVEKEKWMEKPIQQMNEEQKIKLKEYEQKKQKAQQEKERLVKKLQAQLRKLRQQIDEIMERYDQKLFDLLKKKIQYDYRIQEQQVYCARLALTLLDQEQQSLRYKQLEQQIQKQKQNLEQLNKNRSLLASHSQEFEAQKEQKKQSLEKERLGEFESKIKTIEKTIFEEYLTNVKKRRDFEDKLLQHNKEFSHLIIGMDPFKQVESRYLSQTVQKHFSYFLPEIKSLQQTFDIPQNTIQKLLENRFNLRREEHQLQSKLHTLNLTLNSVQQSMEQNTQQLQKEEDQLKKIEEFLLQCKSDLDLQIRIKQGQVQINSQKPVPELDKALLISKAEVDEKNAKIKQQANEKIAVMKEIKTCKIKVTEESLNLQKKEQHITKLSSMIKQIQMLKVKKEMQVALSKKDSKMNENQLKSLKEQIQKVRKQGQKRIALYDDKIKKIHKEIETIRKENKQLQTQKWNLETTVKQREKIKDMMCADGQGGQEAAEKFGQISINRQLFDKAKQQTEEIQLLREELSKLKAKTFANFSNVQR